MDFGTPVEFYFDDKKKKKGYTTLEICVFILIISLTVAAFGLSLKSYLVLNPWDGEVDFGKRNVITDGDMFVRGGLLKVGTDSISVISKDNNNSISVGEGSFALPESVNFSGDTFTFPKTDGTADQVLTTNGTGNLTFTDKGSGGGGTCYGVSTEGGLTLTDGLCFAVVAGNNIVVSSNGVSLGTSLTGIESITMTTVGVSFGSNDTFIGKDGTNLRLISSGTPFNFPGTDGTDDHVLTTDGAGNLTFTVKGSGGGAFYGVSTEGGLSLTDGLCFAVVAGNNIVVSSNGVSLGVSLTGIESITMTTDGVSFGSNDTFIGKDGTSLRLISRGTPFNFPGIDGQNGQFITTDANGNLSFAPPAAVRGTCYGVSTEGGLSLTSGLCFAVVAGNNIVVSSNGVSLGTSLTGIESITMTTGGVSFGSNDTFIGKDGTNLRLISNGTPFNFPGADGTAGQFITTDTNGNLSFATPATVGGTCYGVTTDGGLSLTSGLCFGVIAGDNIRVSANGVSLATTLTGMDAIRMDNTSMIIGSGSSKSLLIRGAASTTTRAGSLVLFSGEGASPNSNGVFQIRYGGYTKISIEDPSDIKFSGNLVPNSTDSRDIGSEALRWDKVRCKSLEIAGTSIAVTSDGTSLQLVSSGTSFNFPGGDGENGQVLTTDGSGNLKFTSSNIPGTWSTLGGKTGVSGPTKISLGYDAGLRNGVSSVAIGYETGKVNQGVCAVAFGSNAGDYYQGDNAIAIGEDAGEQRQGVCAIAIGYQAGYTRQEICSIAIGGYGAGRTAQLNNSIILNSSGSILDNTIADTFTVKSIAKQSITTEDPTLMYNNVSGEITYSDINIVTWAALDGKTGVSGPTEIALGYRSGDFLSDGSNSVALGYRTGGTSQGTSSVSIGYHENGQISQGTCSVSIGYNAGSYYQGERSVAIGSFAGMSYQGKESVAVGTYAGYDNQGDNCVSVGKYTGYENQGDYSIAIGTCAGYENQSEYSVAIGSCAGYKNQGVCAIAIGSNAGMSNQGDYSIALGAFAGMSHQPSKSIIINATGESLNAISENSFVVKPIREGVSSYELLYITDDYIVAGPVGTAPQPEHYQIVKYPKDPTQFQYGLCWGNLLLKTSDIYLDYIYLGKEQIEAPTYGPRKGVFIGAYANLFRNIYYDIAYGTHCTAIGYAAGAFRMGRYGVAIGSCAGASSMGPLSVAIGYHAAATNNIVNVSGTSYNDYRSISIGSCAGMLYQGKWSIAIGSNAGMSNQGQTISGGDGSGYAVAIGLVAGKIEQGSYAVAIGSCAGLSTQGIRSVAIGNKAGEKNQGTSCVSIGGHEADSNLRMAYESDNHIVSLGYNSAKSNTPEYTVAIGALTAYMGPGSRGFWNIATGNVGIGFKALRILQGRKNNVAIGHMAKWSAGGHGSMTSPKGGHTVAIGGLAGMISQHAGAVAIGSGTAGERQGVSAVAIGHGSGNFFQGFGSVAIGTDTQKFHYEFNPSLGPCAIAIGAYAGTSYQHMQSIIINASGTSLNSRGSNRTYVKPIRNDDSQTTTLGWNNTTKQVTRHSSEYFINKNSIQTVVAAGTSFSDFQVMVADL